MRTENAIWKRVSFQNNEYGIYECDKHYELRAKCGTFQFDKNKRVLNSLLALLALYRNPMITTMHKIPILRSSEATENGSRINYICQLPRFFYAIYHQIPIEALDHIKVRFLDGHHNNLRKSNLFIRSNFVKSCVLRGKRYIVLHDPRYKNALSFTEYKHSLFHLLKAIPLRYNRKDHNFMGTVDEKPYLLHQVIWAYYHNDVTYDSLVETIKNLYDGNSFSIDHKYSPVQGNPRFDNRILNLQFIDAGDNKSKHDWTMKIGERSFYFPTLNGEIYGSYSEDEQRITYHVGNGVPSSENIQALKEFCKTGNIHEGVERTTLPITDPKAQEIIAAIEHDAALYQEVLKKYGNQECEGTE